MYLLLQQQPLLLFLGVDGSWGCLHSKIPKGQPPAAPDMGEAQLKERTHGECLLLWLPEGLVGSHRVKAYASGIARAASAPLKLPPSSLALIAGPVGFDQTAAHPASLPPPPVAEAVVEVCALEARNGGGGGGAAPAASKSAAAPAQRQQHPAQPHHLRPLELAFWLAVAAVQPVFVALLGVLVRYLEVGER